MGFKVCIIFYSSKGWSLLCPSVCFYSLCSE